MTYTDRRKGSISVFLALVLCVFLTLVFALLESARFHAGKAVAERAAESAADCVLSGYQRELYERYGLFFLDGSFGTGISDPEMAEQEFSLWFEKNCGGSFLSLQLQEARLIRTVTAADYGGEIFRDSALRTETVLLSGGEMNAAALSLSAAQSERILSVLQAGTAYYSVPANPGAGFLPDSGDTEAQRILAAVRSLSQKPYLQRFLPTGTLLSGSVLPAEGRPSLEMRDERELPDAERFSGTSGLSAREEQQLFLSYLAEYFPCFSEEQDLTGLGLEAEYLVCGKSSDEENLDTLFSRLYPALMGRNLQAVKNAAGIVAETSELAAEYEELTGRTEPVQDLLLRAYAEAETACEIRALLQGGRIPYDKTESCWIMRKTEIGNLSAGLFPGKARTDAVYSVSPGFSWKELLRAYLSEVPQKDLSYRAMDLVQENLREINSAFLMCSLLFDMEFEVRAAGQSLFTKQPLFQNMHAPALRMTLPPVRIRCSYR